MKGAFEAGFQLGDLRTVENISIEEEALTKPDADSVSVKGRDGLEADLCWKRNIVESHSVQRRRKRKG